MKKVRIGTRDSLLALKQTDIVVEQLKACSSDLEFDIVKIKTKGDKILDISLSKIGGKGLFIKEIEEALLKDEVDIAIHSLKDLPADIHEEFELVAFTEREDPADCLISKNSLGLNDLPMGAKIGTSSLRRAFQIESIRPDLEILPLRGNIHTRIRKLEEGQFDAIVLATAGIKRMDMSMKITEILDTNKFIPAVGQGIICVEAKKNNSEIIKLLKKIDNNKSRISACCERAYLRRLNGNCKLPIGALCEVNHDKISLIGMFGDSEIARVERGSVFGSVGDGEKLGIQLADLLKSRVYKS